MSSITTNEGVKIFYKDWGKGQPIVFSHGWPLNADAWDAQMLYFLDKGFRVIAFDRRGHGRSSQTFEKNTMDQFADDLAELLNELDLEEVILVGHSMAGGEVVRYVAKHGTKRISRLVLLGAIPPLMIRTEKNPQGVPREIFDQIRDGLAGNRSEYFKRFTSAFFGFNRTGKVIEGVRDAFWMQAMMGGIKAQFDCVEQFSETDFTEDLKKIDVPTLVIHGSDDQIVPIGISAMLSSKLIPNAQLKVYENSGHGVAQVDSDRFNDDLLEFIESETSVSPRADRRQATPKTDEVDRSAQI